MVTTHDWCMHCIFTSKYDTWYVYIEYLYVCTCVHCVKMMGHMKVIQRAYMCVRKKNYASARGGATTEQGIIILLCALNAISNFKQQAPWKQYRRVPSSHPYLVKKSSHFEETHPPSHYYCTYHPSTLIPHPLPPAPLHPVAHNVMWAAHGTDTTYRYQLQVRWR